MRTATRTIAQPAMHGGIECVGSDVRAEKCSTDPCPGIQVIQKISLRAFFINKLYRFILSNESLIFLVDCEWDEWSECQNLDCKGDGLSPSTGTGMKHRLIKVAESNGGKACSGGETKPCIEPCPGI